MWTKADTEYCVNEIIAACEYNLHHSGLDDYEAREAALKLAKEILVGLQEREPVTWPFYTVVFDKNSHCTFMGEEYVCDDRFLAARFSINQRVSNKNYGKLATVIAVRYVPIPDEYQYVILEDSKQGARPTIEWQGNLMLLPVEKE